MQFQTRYTAAWHGGKCIIYLGAILTNGTVTAAVRGDFVTVTNLLSSDSE
jgi:hypothetical protein